MTSARTKTFLATGCGWGGHILDKQAMHGVSITRVLFTNFIRKFGNETLLKQYANSKFLA